MNRKIASHYALISGELRKNIVVEVSEDRTIVSVREVRNLDSEAHVEFYPGILIPGMVNAHCHLELSYLAGAIPEGTGFSGFAGAIGAVRNNFSNEERIAAASRADSRMWHEGVEAVVDITNDELVMPVKSASKIEYHTLFELFGFRHTTANDHFAIAQRHPNSSVTPHSIYSVSDEPFKQICNNGDMPLSIHFLESPDEKLLYEHKGSLAEWYGRMGWECDFLHYETPSRRIVESIPSTRRLLLVHGCMALASDIRLLNDHFDIAPTWVVCPESNRYISNLKPPYDTLLTMNVPMAIGTDSAASARSLSMIDNMRLIENVPLARLLEWATLGGAKAIGIDNRIGSIEVGKKPGLVVIEGADLHEQKLTAESRAIRII